MSAGTAVVPGPAAGARLVGSAVIVVGNPTDRPGDSARLW
jgi:hypothetical protein